MPTLAPHSMPWPTNSALRLPGRARKDVEIEPAGAKGRRTAQR